MPKLTAKAFERYGFHSAEIMAAWPSVAGSDIATISAPERLVWPRGGARASIDGSDGGASAGATLMLRIEPAHALDVSYRLGEIADRINRYFGYRAVAAVKIVQAPLQREATAQQPSQERQPSAVPEPPHPLTAVADERLKSALLQLWAGVAADRARR
ncbi:MAG: DUF721 domain-containing protein [Hyphomicrobium sp.]